MDSLGPSLCKKLTGHHDTVTALFFNCHENFLASGSLDNSILLWDISDKLKRYRFIGHDKAVMDVTFSPSGEFMASASCDKTTRLWKPTIKGSTRTFQAHSDTVRSIQYSSDGTKLITASNDKKVKIWSSDKHKLLASLTGHINTVRRASISSDSSIIASCSDDQNNRLWDTETAECIHAYKDLKGHGMYLAWHPLSSNYIAVGTSKGNLKIYDKRTCALAQYYSIHDDAITQLAFHPSGKYILTASLDKTMKILDLILGQPLYTITQHGPIKAVAFTPCGEMFASAGDDKMISLWQTNLNEPGDLKENIKDCSNLPKPHTCKDIGNRNKSSSVNKTKHTN